MGLGTVGDLALVVIGFSLIIFIHELGHFAAARWAGIRVLAFALGFGPAVVSYRKGLGFRRGSSEGEYKKLLEEDKMAEAGIGGLIEQRAGGMAGLYQRKTSGISPTEYRWNFLPLGGYVKMLGQDDSDPGATSGEPDSFSRAPVYKRMIVISAGVVMNIITAAILFVIVFSWGLKTESSQIGFVAPGSAAATAVATLDGKEVKGLKVGDTVVSVDGESTESFKDISLAVAMSRSGRPIDVVVKRVGFSEPLRFSAKPTVDPGSRMLALGVGPAYSGRIAPTTERNVEALAKRFKGAHGVLPGMTLVDASGKEMNFDWLTEAAAKSGGQPFVSRWRAADASESVPPVEIMLTPTSNLQEAIVEQGGAEYAVEHLAGLTPLLAVRAVIPGGNAEKKGVLPGDIFVRLGDVQWPSQPEALRQIRLEGRKTIRTSVLRAGKVVDLGDIEVSDKRIGIEHLSTAETSSLVTHFPSGTVTEGGASGKPRTTRFAASVAEVPAGSRILSVGERQTPTLREVRAAVQELLAAGQTSVPLTLELPGPEGVERKTVTMAIHLEPADAAAIAALGWESPIPAQAFELLQVELKRSSPIAAVGKGLVETKKMILTTYLTFARLLQGSVKVEHLKGPIGIADVGTQLAGKGFIWLLFFMAAVSVNLAVVNFLPLPIVDGGHFCFLLWEQFTGKPVSAAVQNVAALAGLALIGAVFLMTTYNDLANLFR